jgi:hypothetical protein
MPDAPLIVHRRRRDDHEALDAGGPHGSHHGLQVLGIVRQGHVLAGAAGDPRVSTRAQEGGVEH